MCCSIPIHKRAHGDGVISPLLAMPQQDAEIVLEALVVEVKWQGDCGQDSLKPVAGDELVHQQQHIGFPKSMRSLTTPKWHVKMQQVLVEGVISLLTIFWAMTVCLTSKKCQWHVVKLVLQPMTGSVQGIYLP
jgi:hypothetical protein